MTREITVESIQQAFAKAGYICNSAIAMTMLLAYKLEKPVLVEGPPGVGEAEAGRGAGGDHPPGAEGAGKIVSGTLWLDDVSIVPIPPHSTPALH